MSVAIAGANPLDLSAAPDLQRALAAPPPNAALAPLLHWPAGVLQHVILAEDIDYAARLDYEPASQRRFQWTAANVGVSTADANWHGLDVFNSALDGGAAGSDIDLFLDPGGLRPSYSVVMAISAFAATFAQDSYLFQQRSSASAAGTVQGFWRYLHSLDQISFSPTGASGNANGFARALLPAAADTPFVLGLDYDGAATSQLWLNDATTPAASKTNHTQAPVLDDGYHWRLLNRFGDSTTAWRGKFGLIAILNGVWSPQQRADIFAFAKSRLGL